MQEGSISGGRGNAPGVDPLLRVGGALAQELPLRAPIDEFGMTREKIPEGFAD
ncbi:MAG: hypothetical protein WCB46_02895 [Methanoregula sp.]